MNVGRNLSDVAYKAIQARDKIDRERVQEASLSEIAEEIDLPLREVVSALDAIAEPVSLYEPVFSETDEGMQIIDQLRDPETEEDRTDVMTLREGIRTLPEREREVLIARYYKGKTQTEIARALRMSQAQVSRLEKSAIARLKEAF